MPRNKQAGLFITLEGGEGAGKTTQLARLVGRLESEGLPVYRTREPGGTPAAEALRKLLLFGDEHFCWQAEIMTHMAARADHLAQAIQPALEEGKIVICDRFHDSTWAYQGYGIGEGRREVLDYISSLRRLVGGEPDVTFWLDLPCERARQRVAQRGGKVDRYEGQKMQFHQRVREGFWKMAECDPDRIVRVDASQSVEEVQEHLYRLVHQQLAGRAA
ncbi:dTMP kinase [Bombella sp. TMW 2.2559]|uniref:Thymidylate kinase n=1 Tax=Bombella dulcis TaxID=2967339 RepID=A0ABT3W9S1_9PROT|nr:dTMP kinase [Bombella dulcis]MCX5615862.1 dTMP kinase [Bombella dulcis]